jgi:glucosamine--fructose-6-phosphate aminotransferase (isomerizing)
VTFFVYLAGQYLGLPVASLPPSLFTVYASKIQLEDALVIGVSQSGESSDVIEGLRVLRTAGATTLAISNQPGSSLEQAAEFSLQQQAGIEQAVAATKTFSSQLMVLASLVARWSQHDALIAALTDVPEQMRRLLASQEAIERAALRFTHAESAYILGRGLSFAAALELALKLKETSYLHAQAYSSAEFQHGPIAAVGASEPIILLGNNDGTIESNLKVIHKLHDLDADLTVISAAGALLEPANSAVPLMTGLHPVSETFLQVLAGQLLALHLTISKGLNPDAPRHISKVTKTM